MPICCPLRRRTALLGIVACLAITLFSFGNPTFYSETDAGTASGNPRPNSDAAAAAFDAAASAVSPIKLVDFESETVGDTTWYDPYPGGAITPFFQDPSSITAGIRNDNTLNTGYNVTSGGSKFLRLVPNVDDQTR